MNPLTQIKNTQRVTKAEIELGLTDKASWHDRFKHSAYVFAGGLPFELTEGDLLAVFAQYGEVVDIHLVRDKKTGKSRGFAFLAYEDQRSTVLSVDNLSGARVAGRVIRVEHVDNYKRKRAEMEGEPVPDSEDEDEEAAAQQAAAQQQRQQADNGGAAATDAGGGGGSEPWGGSTSIVSLLTATAGQGKVKTWAEIQAEAARKKREQEAAAEAAAGGWGPPPARLAAELAGRSKKEKKEKKKHKKEKKKKEKKDKKEKLRPKGGGTGSTSDDSSSEEEGQARPALPAPAAANDHQREQLQGPAPRQLRERGWEEPEEQRRGGERQGDERRRSPQRRSRSPPRRFDHGRERHRSRSRSRARRDRDRGRTRSPDRRHRYRRSRSPSPARRR